MSLRGLGGVMRLKLADYVFWLIAYLGGIILAYLAAFTIWGFHGIASKFIPTCENYLMTGTIVLAATGISYLRLNLNQEGITLSPILSITWPILLMLVYGVLIALGVKPTIRTNPVIWIVCIFIFISLVLWSSIIWLHEQGLRMETKGRNNRTEENNAELEQTAQSLPRVEEN